jgi:hypothetical protein
MKPSTEVSSYAFIDCEYAYTCAARENQVPNYKNLTDLIDGSFSPCVKIAYHVGDKEKKTGVSDFLSRIGIDYNVVLDYHERTSKTQLVGSQMAIDTMRYLARVNKAGTNFVYVTGDDYLVPIIEELSEHDVRVHVFHWPIILSRALDPMIAAKKFSLNTLNNRYFTYPKRRT